LQGDGEILSKTEDTYAGKNEQCIQNVNIHCGTEKATDEEANIKVNRVYWRESRRWVGCQEQTKTEKCK